MNINYEELPLKFGDVFYEVDEDGCMETKEITSITTVKNDGFYIRRRSEISYVDCICFHNTCHIYSFDLDDPSIRYYLDRKIIECKSGTFLNKEEAEKRSLSIKEKIKNEKVKECLEYLKSQGIEVNVSLNISENT